VAWSITHPCIFNISCHDYHWRRLVKNIGWANPNIGGAKCGKN